MPGMRDAVGLAAGDEAADSAAGTGVAAEADPVLLFSQGVISRKQVMRRLGIEYGELLDKVADRSLPLPRVSEEEADQMAGVVVALMDLHTR